MGLVDCGDTLPKKSTTPTFPSGRQPGKTGNKSAKGKNADERRPLTRARPITYIGVHVAPPAKPARISLALRKPHRQPARLLLPHLSWRTRGRGTLRHQWHCPDARRRVLQALRPAKRDRRCES